MGGDNSGQLIEFVHSFDPRGWSCLHIAEGTFQCSNQTIQNNDIGPCGTDAFQEWADGISLSCMNTVVRNNMVNNPTVSSRTMVRSACLTTLPGRWNCHLRGTLVHDREQHNLGR